MGENDLLSVDDRAGIRRVRILQAKMIDTSSIRQLAEELLNVAEESQRIVLNLEAVEFLSSAALHALVTLYRKVGKAGGRLAICCPGDGLAELFRITRCDQIFDLYGSEEEAVRSFAGPIVEIRCPLFACAGWTRQAVLPTNTSRAECVCPRCGTEFVTQERPDHGALTISRFSVPTYQRECIRVIRVLPTHAVEKQERNPVTRRNVWSRWWRRKMESDQTEAEREHIRDPGDTGHVQPHDLVQVEGRLDLFAGELLVRTCRSIPEPRRILVDLQSANDITDPGLQAVSELCCSPDRDVDRYALVVRCDQRGQVESIIGESLVFEARRDAVSYLNDGRPATPMFVTMRQRLEIGS